MSEAQTGIEVVNLPWYRYCMTSRAGASKVVVVAIPQHPPPPLSCSRVDANKCFVGWFNSRFNTSEQFEHFYFISTERASVQSQPTIITIIEATTQGNRKVGKW